MKINDLSISTGKSSLQITNTRNNNSMTFDESLPTLYSRNGATAGMKRQGKYDWKGFVKAIARGEHFSIGVALIATIRVQRRVYPRHK